MRATIVRALSIGAAALVALAGNATIASAQAQQQQLPKGWSYDIRSGQRVAKTNRVSNADGSWREEARQGNCVTVKERSATGEYKTSSECTPAKPQ
jgi:hypothetical protein